MEQNSIPVVKAIGVFISNKGISVLSRAVLSQQSLCPHPSWIEIDLGQFQRNLTAIRSKIGKRFFCLPVKANAYGHGLVEIGKAAEESQVVDLLAVSCLKEAVSLRAAGIRLPIFVFGALHEDQIEGLIRGKFEFSVSSKFKAELVTKECVRLKKKCRVHIEVDTGMNRTGMRPNTAIEVFQFLKGLNCFEVVGIYSHLATADVPGNSFALKQIEVFRSLISCLGKGAGIYHLANSGGVAFYPEAYFDMVRPGLLAYGYFPDGRRDPEGEIASCFSLKSKVSYFKVVFAEEGISYGHLYRAKEQTRIVTVPVGYGDGYWRFFGNRAPVLIRGRRYTVSGAVCMDQFMVDIGSGEAYVGDEVVLIGKQGKEEIFLAEMAQLANTIPYELLCTLNERLPRIYVNDSKRENMVPPDKEPFHCQSQ